MDLRSDGGGRRRRPSLPLEMSFGDRYGREYSIRESAYLVIRDIQDLQNGEKHHFRCGSGLSNVTPAPSRTRITKRVMRKVSKDDCSRKK